MKNKYIIISFALISILINFSVTFGQYHSFGRNKIQYTDFEWQVLSTKHFDIYYYPEMEELALIGAQTAEESYKILQNKYNHALNHKVPLIFYSSHLYFQQTNVIPNILPEGVGGFFEFFKGRVVIPSDGSISQFKRVIRHELNHVFMHSKLVRVQKNHKIMNKRFPPLWFSEGLAEFWSGQPNTQAEMVIRDAVLNNYLVPVDRLFSIAGTFLMYKEGENLLAFISERYGEEKILLILENYWVHPKFSEVVKYTLGVDYKELNRQWTYHLKKKYYPLLQDKDKPQMASKIIDNEGFNSKPAIYKDKDGIEKIIYVSNKIGYTGIYQKDLDGDVNDEAEFVLTGEKSNEYETFHLFRSSISVNNDRILAFVTKSGETDVIHRLNLDTGSKYPPLQFDNLVTISSPSWSPDGRKIAFTGLSRNGYNDIYIYDITGDKLSKLTNDTYDDRDPSWSPNGKHIVFSSDRTQTGEEGKYNLFKIRIKDLKIKYLTYGDHNDRAPKYSKDGKLIFYSDRGGMDNIWMLKSAQRSDKFKLTNISDDDINLEMPENGLLDYKAVRLTNFTTSAIDPVWTNEGSIVFTAFEDFSFNIMKVDEFKNYDMALEKTSNTPKRTGLWSHKKLKKDISTFGKKYKSGYSLDIAQSQVTQDPIFGTSGGAVIALSDILGNNQYYVLVYNNARTSGEIIDHFNVAVTKVSLAGRTNLAYGLFNFNNRRFNLRKGFFDERRYGGFFSISYPLSFFKRIEATTSLAYSKEDRIGFNSREAVLAVNSVRFIKDNSLWGVTGPLDGERYSLSIAYTNDVRFNNLNYFTLVADYRKYYRLSKRTSYAVRFMYLHSDGSPDREIQLFYLGGSWTLRLYPRFRVWGTRAFIINNEYRFPFIDILGIRFPFGAIGFRGIRGALFFDTGNVYNGERFDNKWETLKGSYGIGVRVRIGGFLVLRYDIGRRTDFRNLPDTIYRQFFFGWDF
ncbi:MAG: PD40 domain-containing protein [Candidatus Marinimicrobia bacterium]|nr:PD40 domain-containing protein [Candidatus Neomarinimicrobiota bacterium]